MLLSFFFFNSIHFFLLFPIQSLKKFKNHSIIVLDNFSFSPFSSREKKKKNRGRRTFLADADKSRHGTRSRDSPGEVYRRIKGTIIFKAITQGRPVKRNIS